MSHQQILSDDQVGHVMDILEKSVGKLKNNRLFVALGEVLARKNFMINLPAGAAHACAIVDHYPNPDFGKAPCCFDSPVIVVYRELQDGKVMVSVKDDFLKDDTVISVLDEVAIQIACCCDVSVQMCSLRKH